MATEMGNTNASSPLALGNLTIAPGVRETASEDGAVLLDIEQGICFSLNPIGLKIWGLLKKGYSLDQIVDALEQEFHLARAELLADTVEFVQSLEAKRLVRRSGQSVAKQSWLARTWPWARQRAGQ